MTYNLQHPLRTFAAYAVSRPFALETCSTAAFSLPTSSKCSAARNYRQVEPETSLKITADRTPKSIVVGSDSRPTLYWRLSLTIVITNWYISELSASCYQTILTVRYQTPCNESQKTVTNDDVDHLRLVDLHRNGSPFSGKSPVSLVNEGWQLSPYTTNYLDSKCN